MSTLAKSAKVDKNKRQKGFRTTFLLVTVWVLFSLKAVEIQHDLVVIPTFCYSSTLVIRFIIVVRCLGFVSSFLVCFVPFVTVIRTN